jgi:hypothetical protein
MVTLLLTPGGRMSLSGIRMLGLVGVSAAAKREIARELLEQFPGQVVAAEQTAIRGIDYIPAELANRDEELFFHTFRAAYETCVAVEKLTAWHARANGHKLVVTDFGRFSIAPHLTLDERTSHFRDLLGCDLRTEMHIYDEVVVVQSVSKEPDTILRDKNLSDIWSLHPRHTTLKERHTEHLIEHVVRIAHRMLSAT